MWSAAILYATLATRQHVVLDLVAGGVLGLLCHLATAGEFGLNSKESSGEGARNVLKAIRTLSLRGRFRNQSWRSGARGLVSAGVEPQIAQLQHLPRQRLAELAFFPLLWAAGAVLTLFALRLHGPPRYAAYGAGLVTSAVAVNGFVLLLHEGCTPRSSPAAPQPVGFRGPRRLRADFVQRIPGPAPPPSHLPRRRRDPDDYHNYSASPRLVWMLHYVRLAVGAFLYVLLIPLLARRYGRQQERRRVTQEYAVLALGWGVAFAVVPIGVLVHAWLCRWSWSDT